MKNKFEKHFFVDTSVVLDSLENLFALSEKNTNMLWISDVVLKELNHHKDKGQDTAFFARQFFRLLNGDGENTVKEIESPIQPSSTNGDWRGDKVTAFECYSKEFDDTLTIGVIVRKEYVNKNEINDIKILEVVSDYNFELVTNDAALKIMAITNKLKASMLRRDSVNSPEKICFKKEYSFELSEKENILKEVKEKEKNYNQIVLKELSNGIETGKKEFFIKINNSLEPLLDDEEYQKMIVPPINLEQKFYTTILRHPSLKIMVVTGSTGSGKTLLALQEGMRRVKDKNSPINGIVYLRNTVTANDKVAELGYRKGDEQQKLSYFGYPLFGNINFILEKQLQKKGASLEKVQEAKNGFVYKDAPTDEFMKEYNIQMMDIAHARGITINNKWIIFDELQNATKATLRLIGTRVGEGSVLVCMGDFRQVDHPYLSKNRNALVSLLEKATIDNNIAAIQLRKTVRSDIANWFQENFE